jgi:transposase
MRRCREVFVGIDTAKARNAIAIAEAGRQGEVRYLGEFDNTPDAVAKLVRKLGDRYETLHFCYEAGPTGYGLYRQILAMEHGCMVVAPSLIPRRPGERVKTNRRDALSLARLLRAAELTAVWVPDETHEAVRDLVRTRAMAVEDYRRKRQHISAFLLRHGRAYEGGTTWKGRHLRWLDGQNFAHAAQRFAFQEMLNAMRAAVERIDRLDAALVEIVPDWTMAPVVAAFQAMRGVGFLTATAVVAEAGDLRRFEHPRQRTIRALHGRHEAAGRDHQDRKQQCTKGTGRSGLDLSTFRRCGNDTSTPTATAAAASARNRMEGPEPVVRPLSTAHCEGEAQYCGDHRDRPRDRSLPVGNRTRGRARVGHTTEDVSIGA